MPYLAEEAGERLEASPPYSDASQAPPYLSPQPLDSVTTSRNLRPKDGGKVTPGWMEVTWRVAVLIKSQTECHIRAVL